MGCRASTTFSQILSFSGATAGLAGLIDLMGANSFWVLMAMMGLLLILGCFIDQVSMVMITVPLFIPMAHVVGIDLVWLGVIYLITMEVSLLTPPFGLLLFVMKGIAPPNCSINTVYRAALPFVVMELLVLASVVIFPELGLWLPSLVK